MYKMDLKFSGILTKNKDNSIIPQDQWVVFLAKDNAFPDTLLFYHSKCRALGASQDQLDAIEELYRRVMLWRTENPELCKVLDVEPDELLIN